jgi:hydroxymethylglutaryl-CoA synthase
MMKNIPIGIVGYGAYLPCWRIRAQDIACAWHQSTDRIASRLGLQEKVVPGHDEDTATLAVQASRNALSRAGIFASDIGAVFIGSESHPLCR